MPISFSSQRQPYTARQNFYMLLAIMFFGLIYGPRMFLQGINANNRGRASLQWPKTAGTMTQCDVIVLPGVHSSGYKIAATYTYVANGQQYTGHQVNLWGRFEPKEIANFVANHPVSSSVDVYYDPQNTANAVLIPGADEAVNQYFIVGGSIAFAIAIFGIFQLPSKFVSYRAQMQKEKTTVSS